MTKSTFIAACLALFAAATPLAAQAQQDCGPLKREAGGYGPYDYRTQRDKLKVVEDFHFTPKVERLSAGQSATVGQDISYLMRTSPNHHRGLMAIMRFVEKTGSPQPRDMQYTIDCYFDRAVRYAPTDTIVRVLFARFLATRKDLSAAKVQLDTATQHAKENGLTHFNIGLAYFDLGFLDEALERAHAAQANGFTRPDLENRLREKGHWRPAEAAAAASAVASAPSAASR